MKSILLGLSLLLASPTLFAQTYTGDKTEIATILENVAYFSQQVMAGNDANIAACYTEDAKIFPRNQDIISGKDDIQRYWAPREGYQTSHHKVTPSEIKIMGDEAYDYGYYEGTTKSPDGSERSWRGKYIIVWKKIAGEWKIYLDIWNSI